jgi:antitoxin MazE
MTTRFQKWGNSLGVRIPKALADEAGIQAGTAVDVRIEDGCLVLTPARRPVYKLKDLVARITAKNLHKETDFGPPTGKEVW